MFPGGLRRLYNQINPFVLLRDSPKSILLYLKKNMLSPGRSEKKEEQQEEKNGFGPWPIGMEQIGLISD